jgi:hypothetical protein
VGIFAQSIDRHGRARWETDGVAVRTGSGERPTLAVLGDRQGAAYVAWSDTIGGNHVRAQRLTREGRVAPAWPADGRVVSRKGYPAARTVLSIVESGRQSAIVAWSDAGWGSLAMRLTPRGPASERVHPAEEWLDDEGVAEGAAPPRGRLRLGIIQPSPATSGATIRFELAGSEPAMLELLDVAGRRVWSCGVGELGPGAHAVPLAAGMRLEHGVYFARLVQAGRSAVRRVVWVR